MKEHSFAYLMKTLVSILLTAIIIQSCDATMEVKALQEEYVVHSESKIGDSIVVDESVNYFVTVNYQDSIIKWSKRYFEEDEIEPGKVYLMDSLSISVLLTPTFEISKMINYHEIFAHIQNESSKILENTPVDKRPFVQQIIENVSLDSNNIMRVHTQDIDVFAIGLNFLYNEKDFKIKPYKISNEGNYRKLTANNLSKFSLDRFNFLTSPQLFSLEDIVYHYEVEILKDSKNKTIKYLSYTISFVINKVKHSTTTHISLLR